MIEQYETLKFIDENGQINLTASPVYKTEILKTYGLVCNGKVQITNDFAVYSPYVNETNRNGWKISFYNKILIEIKCMKEKSI